MEFNHFLNVFVKLTDFKGHSLDFQEGAWGQDQANKLSRLYLVEKCDCTESIF